ncbi:MAG: hypothetical protein ABI566_11420 [Pseudolysinimonas sp.]
MRTPVILLTALLTLSLTACGGAPTPESTFADPDPAPTETATPTPEPDPSTIVARVDVSTLSMVIVAADDSTIDELSVYDPAADVIAAFTDAFGAAPAVSDNGGGLETAPSRVYDWSGFSIIDYEGQTIMNTDFIVVIGAAVVGDVQISASGLKIGDPASSAVAAGAVATPFPDYLAIDSVPITGASVGESFEGLAIYTSLVVAGGSIDRIVAPSPNWGV